MAIDPHVSGRRDRDQLHDHRPRGATSCLVLPVPASPHFGVGTGKNNQVTDQHGRKVRIVQGWVLWSDGISKSGIALVP